jgi:hypothetical protein
LVAQRAVPLFLGLAMVLGLASCGARLPAGGKAAILEELESELQRVGLSESHVEIVEVIEVDPAASTGPSPARYLAAYSGDRDAPGSDVLCVMACFYVVELDRMSIPQYFLIYPGTSAEGEHLYASIIPTDDGPAVFSRVGCGQVEP